MNPFLVGIFDDTEAMCPKCKSYKSLTTGNVTNSLVCPACVCGYYYQWDDGRPMLIFPSNIGEVFHRMEDVFSWRCLPQIGVSHDCGTVV